MNWLLIIKKKENLNLLIFLLIFLIVPRIVSYAIFGNGIISADAENRYFPQVEQLSKSFSGFFSQTGAFYTLFLFLFKKIANTQVTGPVLFQHILGIISALLVFYYFKKINPYLAFFVVIFSFSVPISIWLEHTILRETFASFFIIIFIILLTLVIKNKDYFKFSIGFITGFFALLLVSLRVEMAVLAVSSPLILFLAQKRKQQTDAFNSRLFLKWIFGYFCPFLIALVFFSLSPQKPNAVGTYGSLFNIAYYSLQPDVYNYKNSEYPVLLEKYREIIKKNNGDTSKSMVSFYEETENYLKDRPEISLSFLELRDKIFIEIMSKNTLIYLKSYAINLKSHLLGIAEIKTLISKYKAITGIFLIDQSFWMFNFSIIIFNWVLFLLFLAALPIFFIQWRKLPDEVFVAVLFCVTHLLVLSFFANPAHRFRYSLDPFIYFSQFYLIILLFKLIKSKVIKQLIKNNE